MKGLSQALAPLAGRIQAMVGRAIVAAIDDGTTLQSLQIELTADEAQDGVEHFQSYGLATHPKVGAEAVALTVGGLRSHAIVVAVADRRYRFKGLSEGEVALYDDLGQSVHLTRDGIVITSPLGIRAATEGDYVVEAGGDIRMTAGGEMLVDGATILLGEGASLDAARKTDTVSGSAITGGSGKVKIA